MGRGAGAAEGGEGQQAGQQAGHPSDRGGWRQVLWGRGGHDLTGGGRQARMLEAVPFKGVGGRDSRRRGLEAAWAGARGPGAAPAPNR
jgi:hypothetical protein